MLREEAKASRGSNELYARAVEPYAWPCSVGLELWTGEGKRVSLAIRYKPLRTKDSAAFTAVHCTQT
jgi:hypothetical protein